MTPAPQLLATAFGTLMIAAAGVQPGTGTIGLSVAAVIAVVAGVSIRPAAVLAVGLTVAVIAFADPPPVLAALSGLAAVGYLLLRFAVGARTPTVTRPALLGALGFAVLGVAAASIPVDLPRLPLVAPLVLLAIYVVVTLPFTARTR